MVYKPFIVSLVLSYENAYKGSESGSNYLV